MSSSSFVLVLCVSTLLSAHAFVTPSSLLLRSSRTTAGARKCTSTLLMSERTTQSSELLRAPFTDRRSVIAAALAFVALPKNAKGEGSDEVVVTGELRLEVGSDKKLEKVGGKATANVILRIVGKGIVSKTAVEINLPDFPAPGQPKPGESGGVPFVVKASDLLAKTDKGYTVTREMWEDDDIFVAVDVNVAVNGKDKRILRGIGKAKMKPVDGVKTHQKPLVLLE